VRSVGGGRGRAVCVRGSWGRHQSWPQDSRRIPVFSRIRSDPIPWHSISPWRLEMPRLPPMDCQAFQDLGIRCTALARPHVLQYHVIHCFAKFIYSRLSRLRPCVFLTSTAQSCYLRLAPDTTYQLWHRAGLCHGADCKLFQTLCSYLETNGFSSVVQVMVLRMNHFLKINPDASQIKYLCRGCAPYVGSLHWWPIRT
jgi:hypothetical protein